MARDGIAGYWQHSTRTPPHLADSDAYARFSAPWVRAITMENEIVGPLVFKERNDCDDANTPAVSIYHTAKTIPDAAPALGDVADLETQTQLLADLIAPTPAILAQQLDLVANYIPQRSERLGEAVGQIGFPTPFFETVLPLHPASRKFTRELVSIAQSSASEVVIRVKKALRCRRPNEFSPQLQPIVPTPGHGTLPSGHSTEAFVVARMLDHLMNDTGYDGGASDWATMLLRQAHRIAVNRTVAGVHFPVDSLAGAALGLMLGDYIVSLAKQDAGEIGAFKFVGSEMGSRDFLFGSYFAGTALQLQDGISELPQNVGLAHGVEDAPTLAWLWTKAMEEWA